MRLIIGSSLERQRQRVASFIGYRQAKDPELAVRYVGLTKSALRSAQSLLGDNNNLTLEHHDDLLSPSFIKVRNRGFDVLVVDGLYFDQPIQLKDHAQYLIDIQNKNQQPTIFLIECSGTELQINHYLKQGMKQQTYALSYESLHSHQLKLCRDVLKSA